MIKITDNHDCCGCTGCASICSHGAISMQADNEGFLYPKINTSLCSDCGLCERVCPIIQRDRVEPSASPLIVFALHNKQEETWHNSSSGGVFAALVEYCIKRGGIVYGAEYDDEFVVIHRGENTIEGALKFRGSKYVQSDLRGIYREIRKHLTHGREVLFSGTPCQVEGLKCFLLKSYDNLTTVDILCHGVPSPRLFSEYIKYVRQHSISSLVGINMKDKTFGWGYQNLRLYFKNGYSEFNTPMSNLWNRIFYGHVGNRPSCHECRFTNMYRPGDLSIGDFWGIEKSYPEFVSENGVSLLLVNSGKGKAVWNSIDSEFDFIESNQTACLQPCLCHSQPEADNRAEFWKSLNDVGFDRTIRYYYGISYKDVIRNYILQTTGIIREYLKH